MKYLFLLGSALVLSTPARAEEPQNDEGLVADLYRGKLITVLGTGVAEQIDQTGQSVSLVFEDELASVQGADLTRTLERLPGVTITRNGGLGNFTGLRVRGAEAEQLLVLVDGVRVNDQAAPAGGYDLGNLMAGGIGKIELLRGSNSVVWGSQAIGGVLAVTSREFDGVEARAEYGSNDTFVADGVAGITGNAGSLTLNAGYLRGDGISSAAVGSEPDGFRQWRVGGRGRLDLTGGLSATLTARHTDSRLDIDGFPPPSFSFADTPEFQKSRETSGRVGLSYFGDSLQLDGGFALSNIDRAYFDPRFAAAPNYETRGRSQRLDLTGKANLAPGLRLTFGADGEWTRFSTSFDAEKKARMASGHVLLGFSKGGLNLAAGVRLDDHSAFGSHWTTGANGSFEVAHGWRIRASYGEGFKAPTLFQLFSDFGNRALQPETSRSVDLGIEKGDRNGDVHFAATLFRRDTRDLIDFVSCFGVTTGICAGRPFGTYNNVSRARAEGFELEAGGKPTKRLMLRAAYSYVKSANRATGRDLARRPRNALSLSADWRTPVRDLTLGADLRVVSGSFDNAANTVRLEGYELLTLRASVPVGESVELFGRIENVTDKAYQTAAGYGTAGRTAAIGARARW